MRGAAEDDNLFEIGAALLRDGPPIPDGERH